MILTANNPETSSFTWGYAIGVIVFVAGSFLLLLILRACQVGATRAVRRHVARALDNGDTRLSDAADAMWAARNRPSIPRQLERTRP